MHVQSTGLERYSRRVRAASTLFAVGIFLAAMLASNAQTSPPSPSEATPLVLPYDGATLDRYFERLRQDFSDLDANADGKITQVDVDLHVLMEEVVLHTYAAMGVMRFDLDGDGMVTEDEIRRASRYYFRSAVKGPQQHAEEEVREVMALDADKDGKVSFVEAGKYRYPEMLQTLGLPGVSSRARRALTLESGSGSGVTLEGFTAAGEVLFRKIDSDHNGKISGDELAAYRRAQ
jgi:Ca2+-binding EF-hand superfamily protein